MSEHVMSLDTLQKELTAIQSRNDTVTTDKAWETSWTRRLIIAAGTYGIGSAYLYALGVNNALLHSAVPAGAYLISTLTLPRVKTLWCNHIYKFYSKGE